MFRHISLRWIFLYILLFAQYSADATAIPGASSTAGKVASLFSGFSDSNAPASGFFKAAPAEPLEQPPAQKFKPFFRQTTTSNATAADTIRIMPLGDSNTEGVRSDFVAVENRIAYRAKLEELLEGSKLKGLYDFVGSESTGSAHMNDTNHAGFGGARDEDIAALLAAGKYKDYDGMMRGGEDGFYLDQFDPDIILLHIGTNWVDSSDNSIYDVEKILNQVDSYEKRENKDVTVILAKIILTDGRNPDIDAVTKSYNQKVSAMVKTRVEAGDLIELVDMQDGAGLIYTNTAVGGDMADHLHPNTNGYNKMARVWFNAIMNTNVVLPVELMEFKAAGSQGQVQLKWSTASEQDNNRFEVERMQEGHPFMTIGTVAGAGNSSRLLRYAYIDAGAPAGLLYYRLKQIDDDGTFSYSKIIAVSLPITKELVAEIYPNPTNGTEAIYLHAAGFGHAAPVAVTLRDAMGRKLYQRTETAGTQGELITTVQFPVRLTKGLYIWEFVSMGNTRKLKLLVR